MLTQFRTVTIRTYKVIFDPELNMYFLAVEEGLLKGRQYLIHGKINGNHHPIILTFFIQSYLFFWNKEWTLVSTEDENTCVLEERSPEQVKTDRMIAEHMLTHGTAVLGRPRLTQSS